MNDLRIMGHNRSRGTINFKNIIYESFVFVVFRGVVMKVGTKRNRRTGGRGKSRLITYTREF